MKSMKLWCLIVSVAFAVVAFADTSQLTPPPATSVRGNEQEIAQLESLVANAKAHNQTPNPAWLSRLDELGRTRPLIEAPMPLVPEAPPVQPAHSLVKDPTSPLEQQIRALELQFYSPSGSPTDQPQNTSELKAQLNALYDQRPENRPSPLDQGNDACPATVIPGLPYTDSGTTAGMANNFNPNPACNSSSAPDVIYQLTPTYTGVHTISLAGSLYDTYLYVTTGGACPGTTQIACDDDYFGLQSYLSLTLTAGTTYYIIVDGFSTNAGAYYLQVRDECNVDCQNTAKQECAETQVNNFGLIDCDGGCNVSQEWGGTNQFETIVPGQSVCGRTFTYLRSDNGVIYRDTDWYTFSIPQQCVVTWSVNAEYPISVLILDSNCPTTSLASGSAGACATATASITLAAGTYRAWVGISSWSDIMPVRDYHGTLTAVPTGCPDDGALLAPGSISGNTCGAGNDCSLRLSEDQTIRVAIPRAGTWRFSICSATNNWDSYIYLTTQCCGGTTLASDDDACPEFGVGLSLINNVCLDAGMYFLTVEGFGSANCGPYTLTVSELLGSCCYGDSTNPQCQDGISKCLCDFVGGNWHEGQTCPNTVCGPRPPCADDALYGQLPVLPGEPGENGYFSDFDNTYRAFENFSGISQPISSVRFWGFGYNAGTACTEQPLDVEISFHPDSAGFPSLGTFTARYNLAVTGTFIGSYLSPTNYQGYQYDAVLPTPCSMTSGWICIEGKGGSASCIFAWLTSPQGDNVSYSVTGNSFLPSGTNLSFCLGGQPPCASPLLPPQSVTCYPTVVGGFRHIQLTWVAPSQGTYEIWSSTFPNNDGNPDGGLDPQWHLEASVIVNVSAGTQIWIDPSTIAAAPLYKNYVILQACRPVNDDCEGAIPVYNGLTNYSNNGANTDGPVAPCGSLGSDVWFSYTATCNGTVTVNTCNLQGYDTAIQAFGGSCGNLGASLACNDDFCGNGFQSQISFASTVGNTYLLRIGGFAGSQGNGILSVSCQ